MTDLNTVNLIGRVTRDIGEKEFGYVGNGTARLNISIAVSRSVKHEEQWTDETSFFDVTIWGKTAENMKKFLSKGKQICVSGYLKQDRWEKDGQKFSRVSVVAESVQLLGDAKKSDGNGSFKKAEKQTETPASVDDGSIPF